MEQPSVKDLRQTRPDGITVKRMKPGLYCIMWDRFTVGSVGLDPNPLAKPGTWYVWASQENKATAGLETKEQAIDTLLALWDRKSEKGGIK